MPTIDEPLKIALLDFSILNSGTGAEEEQESPQDREKDGD